jgi:hypothetical protein
MSDFDTEFPTFAGKDPSFMETMLLEKFERHFPAVQWYSLKVISVAQEATVTPPTSLSTFTAVDDLWGEPVPQNIGPTWKQPHKIVETTLNPTQVTQFEEPVKINLRIRKNPTAKQLTRWGIDRKVDLEVRSLKAQFRSLDITPKAGDEFRWRSHRYRIDTTSGTAGRFSETNLYFYTDFLANAIRIGS